MAVEVRESSSAGSLALCVEGVIRATMLLGSDFGVTVRYGQLHPRDAAHWNPAQRQLTIRHALSVEDRLFLLGEMWRALAIGYHATSGTLIPQPQLRLITGR